MMKRTAIPVLVALALGVAAGAFLVHRHLGKQLTGTTNQRDQLRTLNGALEDELNTETARAEGLARENDFLNRAIAEIEEQLLAIEADDAAPIDFPEENLSGPSESDDPSERPRRRSFRQNWAADPPSEEARQRWRESSARRQEWSAGFIDAELSAASDPATQDRLLALSEYPQYMQDLRRQMRSAQTEEDRAALREDYLDANREAWGLLQEQQDHMLRQVASAQGIQSESSQTEFISQLRETLQNPFFSSPGLFTGGGTRGLRGSYPRASPQGPDVF